MRDYNGFGKILWLWFEIWGEVGSYEEKTCEKYKGVVM